MKGNSKTLIYDWLDKNYGDLTKKVIDDKVCYVNNEGYVIFYYYPDIKYDDVYFQKGDIDDFIQLVFRYDYYDLLRLLRIWLLKTYDLKGREPYFDAFNSSGLFKKVIKEQEDTTDKLEEYHNFLKSNQFNMNIKLDQETKIGDLFTTPKDERSVMNTLNNLNNNANVNIFFQDIGGKPVPISTLAYKLNDNITFTISRNELNKTTLPGFKIIFKELNNK